MRTTLDLPDAMLRQLKAKAALEGTTLKAMLHAMLEHGLRALPPVTSASAGPAKGLPTVSLGRPLGLKRPTNAALFGLLDE